MPYYTIPIVIMLIGALFHAVDRWAETVAEKQHRRRQLVASILDN